MDTIGYILSRLRNDVKAVTQDAFLSDRYLYSKLMKFVPALLKREDSKNLLMKTIGIWQSLPYVELTEVDKVETACFNIKSGCTIKRTTFRLPKFFNGYIGPLIKNVTSLSGPATDADDERKFQFIDSSKYASITRTTGFKYNKTRYYWYADGYLWFPNLEWDAVRIEALFEGDIRTFNDCKTCKNCLNKQDQEWGVPEYLYPELENFVIQDLNNLMKTPPDLVDNKQNILR